MSKGGDDKEIGNYRPTDFFNRLFNHLTKKKFFTPNNWISKSTFCRTYHNTINQSTETDKKQLWKQ